MSSPASIAPSDPTHALPSAVAVCYSSHLYPAGHFALCSGAASDDDPFFVATLRFASKLDFTVRLNPTDARGLRCIVVLVDEADMTSTFNRPYSLEEQQGLDLTLALVASLYERVHLLAQIEVAGNNAHKLEDAEAGSGGARVLTVGSAHEPGMLHGHVIGRGDPLALYAGLSAPLGGPVPGCLFNMRADGSDEGNRAKTKWAPDDARTFATFLARGLAELAASNQSLVSFIVTRSRSIV